MDREPTASAPTLIHAEFVNALWRATNAGSVTPGDASIGLVEALPKVGTVSDLDLCERALRLALQYRHAAYDCFYLALAQRERASLLTADRRLRMLAEQEGVSTIPLP